MVIERVFITALNASTCLKFIGGSKSAHFGRPSLTLRTNALILPKRATWRAQTLMRKPNSRGKAAAIPAASPIAKQAPPIPRCKAPSAFRAEAGHQHRAC